MRDQGLLSDGRYRQASAAPLGRDSAVRRIAIERVTATMGDSGLYFQEEIRRQLFALFGADQVLRGGLRVYSTYDPELQRQAESAVTTRLRRS